MELEDRGRGYLEAAWLMFEQGQHGRAREFGRKVLAEDPEQPDALLILGYCALAEKEIDEARELSRSLLASHPREPQAHLLQGHVHAAAEEQMPAENCFREAIRLAPERASSYAVCGRYLGILGRREEGITVARKGLAQDPESLEVLTALQTLYRLNDELDLADEYGARALALDPDVAGHHLEAGLRLLERRQGRDARKSFLESLRISPADGEGKDVIAHERVRAHPLFRDRIMLPFEAGFLVPAVLTPVVWLGLSWVSQPFIWLFWISLALLVVGCLHTGLFRVCRWYVRRRIENGSL